MSPEEVRTLSAAELPALAAEVRRRILGVVSANGGHLASSLGAVELTIALLRQFKPPRDQVVWDVGHQAYAWKLLTDRDGRFSSLRCLDGISGFPNPDESPYDAFVAGHAGAALAAAQGLAAAGRMMKGETGRVVAVVGDAALRNGMALEALCGDDDGRVILVVNDNGRDSERIARVLKASGYSVVRVDDGHDVARLEAALEVAKSDEGPVAVQVRTVKGRGFTPAESDPAGWHGVGPFSLERAEQEGADSVSGGWSETMGEELVRLARADNRICALTAAMREGTGLTAFAREFPERFFDVGICEERMVTLAAGLAKAGMRPVVAVYSTFLQRAVDQVMHDVCLLRLPVVFAVDRAGCVGRDGRTHHGMFDIPMLRCLPNLTICQPADGDELKAMLAGALKADGPWVIRYPRGAVSPRLGEVRSEAEPGRARVVARPEASVQIWALGDWVAKADAVAAALRKQGVEAGVVDARFVKPFDAELLARQRAAGARIVSLENGAVAGGFGEAIGADLRFGWPDIPIGHGAVDELEVRHGLDVPSIVARILNP